MALFQLRYMSWSCFFFVGIGFKDNCRYVGEASSILRRPLPFLYLVRTLLHHQFFSIYSSLFAGSVLFLLGRILNMIQAWKMRESGGSLVVVIAEDYRDCRGGPFTGPQAYWCENPSLSLKKLDHVRMGIFYSVLFFFMFQECVRIMLKFLW